MGWSTDAGGHEGWVANVLADGRISASSTGTGAIVHDVQTDADIAAGYEVRRYPPSTSIDVIVPWSQVATWRVVCTCGWAGAELPACADKNGWRDCPEDVEDGVFHSEWQAHVAPVEALAQVGDLAGQARVIERQLSDKVQLARTAGASWSQIGREVGLSKQGAQQRWTST